VSAQGARYAFVTGAGRRLGNELCRYWLAQGWHVVAHYRSFSAEIETLRSLGAVVLQADFEDDASVLALIEKIKACVPHLDLVVHNASCFYKEGDDLESNLKAMDAFYRVHMKAPYALNLGLEPLLRSTPHEYADVIHITDIFADRPNAMFTAYCSSKAGLANLSMSFAKRFAPKIKVNSIQPGPVKFLDSHSDAAKAAVLRETLLGREGGFEPVVQMVAAIVGNAFLTGAAYKVDGGRSLA
jgi:dihydromonapterin reductase/dihydrofolate reductase